MPKAFTGNTDQLNVQAPDDTATGSVTVTVSNTSNGSASSTVTLGAVGPSFSVLGDGVHAAAIILTAAGYDIDGPVGAFSYPTRPVKAGEYLILYGVGFGPTTPASPSGQPYSGPSGGAPMTDSFTLSFGGDPIPAANIKLSALVGQGLYQFNVLVPSGLGTGDLPLSATVAGVTTPTGVVVAVQ